MALTEVFEEWNTYAAKRPLLARDINFNSIVSNSEFKIVGITGIRRAGKSSALMLLAQKLSKEGKNVCYINTEDSRLKYERGALDAALKWFGDDGFMLLDEVTNAPDWEGWLARTHELLKGRLRLIVSSSRRGLSKPNKPLRGRILTFELYPLSFKEFLRFKDERVERTTAGRGRLERALYEYLKFGGFPEVVLVGDETDKVRILNSYFRDIIGLDIAEASHEDIGAVETFGRYVVQTPYFSASKCLNFFKTLGHRIGKDKLLALEHHSQAGYLFFFVPIFSYSIKDRLQYPRKSYSGDTGFIYSTTGKIDMGRLYENAAFLELKRRSHEGDEFSYWRDREGHETDLVMRCGFVAREVIQVVSDMEDKKTRVRETKGLVRCTKELKAERATILTKDIRESETIDNVAVEFVPLLDWLLA
jgi:predicted AAA+ superfamily ATPase